MKKNIYKLFDGELINCNEYVVFDHDKIIYLKAECDFLIGFYRNNHIKTQTSYDNEVFFDYSLIKLSKADNKYKKHKVNYRIHINELVNVSDYSYFIKINRIELFILNYHKKQTVFHKMNFYKRLLIFIIFGLPTIFLPIICTNQKNESKNSASPNLNTIIQSTNKANINADSVSIQNTKFDFDLLSSDSIINDSLKIDN